ncbi:UNVERIFIED_CONTAM: hypothetical protein K2H54_042310 [Gekko kuhli]
MPREGGKYLGVIWLALLLARGIFWKSHTQGAKEPHVAPEQQFADHCIKVWNLLDLTTILSENMPLAFSRLPEVHISSLLSPHIPFLSLPHLTEGYCCEGRGWATDSGPRRPRSLEAGRFLLMFSWMGTRRVCLVLLKKDLRSSVVLCSFSSTNLDDFLPNSLTSTPFQAPQVLSSAKFPLVRVEKQPKDQWALVPSQIPCILPGVFPLV